MTTLGAANDDKVVSMTVFQRYDIIPHLSSDLVATLAGLEMDDLTHDVWELGLSRDTWLCLPRLSLQGTGVA